ncbi:T cell receptor delta constant isoform X2 [Oryctolagus cuniculus]|uniref:T cell receptor delta constant isoform X2 n=1 Tax=Oryctolagus cuniculus TaxID=9986 RepID=UPI003879E777
MCYWDTRQMFFGTGTKLFVEPQTQPPSSPSVFVMKNGTNVACLVKDFYPKDVNISLQSSKKIKEIGSAIVISPSKKYSAVKLGQYEGSSSVTCSVQHNNKIVNSADFEPNTNLSDNPKPTEAGSVTQATQSYREPKDNPKPTEAGSVTQATQSYREPKVYAEKVNMMSLTVLGLRMLFAKSVAINFLLTAKLFFS